MIEGAEIEVPLEAGSGKVRLTLEGRRLRLRGPDSVVDVDPTEVRYEERTFGDRVQLRGVEYGVARGRGSDAIQAVALARLRGGDPHELALPKQAPWLAPRTRLETTWLERWLEADERVLAWLRTSTAAKIDSAIAKDVLEVEGRFVLTTRRAAFIAVSKLGDVQLEELAAQAMKTDRSYGKVQLTSGETELSSERGNGAAFEAIATLPAASLEDRTLEIARLCARARTKVGKARSAKLLSWLRSQGSAWATLATLHDPEAEPLEDDALRAAVERAASQEDANARFVAWWKGWKIPAPQALSVVERLRAQGEERSLAAAVALRERVRESILRGKSDPIEVATLDLEHVRLLREAGLNEAATALLEERLEKLPEPELLELVPHPDEDPTEDGQAIRVQLLTELVTLRGEGPLDVGTLAEVARLQPLNAERLSALRDAADEPLKSRAAEVLALLEPNALGAPSDGPPLDPKPLPNEALQETLRHPVAREDGALGKLQAALAGAKVPDHGALRSYCEKLSPRESLPHAALTDAVVALGVSGVEAYISRGDKAIGVRAYEGEPSFLLIGGNHLDPESAELLNAAELRFAIAAEIAHLRFKHARVTSTELWNGAFEKGKATLDTVLSVVPLFSALKWGERAATIAGHLSGDAAKRALGLAGRAVGGKAEEPRDAAVGVNSDQLLAAHRVMQFTADRAGLLLSGDLRAAVRAMLLCWPKYSAELPVIDRLGLRAGVSRRGEDGELLHPHLAVRLCALLSFYLDEDYTTLREALRG